MTDNKPTMDDLIARHQAEAENASNDQSDVLAAAKLFNQVGSQLMSIDKMNVGDGPPAMKLKKEAIVNQHARQPVTAQVPPTHPAPQSHAPLAAPPPVHNVNKPVVTLDVNTYNKNLKKIDTLTKKFTKLEKDFLKILDVINIDKKTCKYQLKSENIDMTCRDTITLLSVVAKELDNKATDITISRC